MACRKVLRQAVAFVGGKIKNIVKLRLTNYSNSGKIIERV